MKLTWLAAVVLAACHGGGDDYPIQTGGDDTTIGDPHRDAAVLDGNDAAGGDTITGRACLLVDLRDPVTCAVTGAGGMVVTLGSSMAVTEIDGRFVMPTPPGTNLVWHVSGTDMVPSVMPLGAVPQIPVISVAAYQDALDSTGVLLAPGEASVFLHVVHGAANVPNATATATPTPSTIPYYDGATSTTWNASKTGAAGMVWIAGVDPVVGPAPGQVAITVSSTLGTPQTIALPLEADAITYGTLAIP